MKVKKKNKKTEKNSHLKTNAQIFPIRSYDTEISCFVLADGSYLDIIEKTPEDVGNMLPDEIEYKMILFAKVLKLYKDDMKLVFMNFPTNTAAQQNQLRQKLEKTNDPVRRKWLERKISELERADKGTHLKECYFFIFSQTLEAHQKHIRELSIMEGGLVPMSFQKKCQILFKLANSNSIIIREDEA